MRSQMQLTVRVAGRCLAAMVAVAVLSVTLASAEKMVADPALKQQTERLGSAVWFGQSMETLRELTDKFGGRLSGSRAHQAAAAWAVEKFHSYGIKNVKIETFKVENGWERGRASGEMLAPQSRRLFVESIGWSPSTPQGGVTGDVTVVSDISADALKGRAAEIKGHVILMDRKKIFAAGYVKVLPLLKAAMTTFTEGGALAVMSGDREDNNVINASSMGWRAQAAPLPLFHLGAEDSKLMMHLSEQGTIKVHLESQNTVTGPTDVPNVIAEIPGSDGSGEWILIGGHFDSWDFGTGAQDNGTGSVSVLEAARVIAAQGIQPKRTIRFALWGGEEEGLLGSFAYVNAHDAEMDKCVTVLNTDNGAGQVKGWKVEGRKDFQAAMQPVADAYLKDLGATEVSLETSFDTDHGPFMLKGIPSLDLLVDMAGYFKIHHKASDTYDKVDTIAFKSGVAVSTMTTWLVAESPAIAPHIDHKAVAEILKKEELDEMLTFIGVWKP